jgi:hypothetical protein
MRSVLPERYLAAGHAISKAHNVRVLLLIAAFLSAMILCVPLLSRYAPLAHRQDFAIGYLCMAGLGTFFGIYRIAQHDKAMCFQLRYLCPNCGHPLYSAKGYEKITGRCPACQKTVA